MKTKFLLFIAAVGLHQTKIAAQTKFTYAPEIGLATTGFANCSNTTSGGIAEVNTLKRYQPLNSSLIGLHAGVVWQDNYRFLAGVQYQQVGDTRETYQDGYRPIYDAQGNLGAFYHARYEGQAEQTLHKIAVPVSASYIFSGHSVQPFVQLCYRLNYFVSGKYTLKEVYSDDLGANISNETT